MTQGSVSERNWEEWVVQTTACKGPDLIVHMYVKYDGRAQRFDWIMVI